MLVRCLVGDNKGPQGANPEGSSSKKKENVRANAQKGQMDRYLVSPFLFDPGFVSRLDERGVQNAPLGKRCRTAGAEAGG